MFSGAFLTNPFVVALQNPIIMDDVATAIARPEVVFNATLTCPRILSFCVYHIVNFAIVMIFFAFIAIHIVIFKAIRANRTIVRIHYALVRIIIVTATAHSEIIIPATLAYLNFISVFVIYAIKFVFTEIFLAAFAHAARTIGTIRAV